MSTTCESKPACSCRNRRITLARMMLFLSWVSFVTFLICAESLQRFGHESIRLIRKLL